MTAIDLTKDPYWLGPTRVQSEFEAKKKRRKRPRPGKTPGYPETLAAVRRVVQGFVDAKRTFYFHKEAIARVHGLDPSKVQRALSDLRHEGLVHPPVRGAFAGETWRGGGYDEHSAWSPSRYYAKVPGFELRVVRHPRGKSTEMVPVEAGRS